MDFGLRNSFISLHLVAETPRPSRKNEDPAATRPPLQNALLLYPVPYTWHKERRA
jgi:hypothetical protein